MFLVTDLILVKEFFQHRNDKLHTRVHNYRNGWINEYFHPGRSHSLKGNFTYAFTVFGLIASSTKIISLSKHRFLRICVSAIGLTVLSVFQNTSTYLVPQNQRMRGQ